jgi:phosphate transport system substrate-binding protein
MKHTLHYFSNTTIERDIAKIFLVLINHLRGINSKLYKIAAILIFLFSVINVNAQKATIRIKGSDTMLPLSLKEAESFMKKNPGTVVRVEGGGSSTGIKALIENTSEICMSSRKIKADEKEEISKKNSEVKEVVVAIDALAIIVNPNNIVSKLTREDLERIFSGKVTNWKELGGEDLKIVVFTREKSSGTYVFFQEHILKNKPYVQTAIMMPNTESIVDQVSLTRGAIGYVGHAYIEKGVKTIAISDDNGNSFIDPTIENVRNHTYPISRPLYFYYTKNNEMLVKPIIDFVLSSEGQEIVYLVGYLPVK